MKSAGEAKDSLENLVVNLSKLGKVFRSEGPNCSPVHHGLNHLGIIRTFRLSAAVGSSDNSGPNRSRHARMRQTDPSVDFEREVGVFVDDAAWV